MNTTVELEYAYNATPAQIWTALTDKKEMKKWYFDVDDFKPEADFEFRFWGGTEERQYLHICIIREAVENKKLCTLRVTMGLKAPQTFVLILLNQAIKKPV